MKEVERMNHENIWGKNDVDRGNSQMKALKWSHA